MVRETTSDGAAEQVDVDAHTVRLSVEDVVEMPTTVAVNWCVSIGPGSRADVDAAVSPPLNW